MPQPETLTASLGMLQITATEKGYTIVDGVTNEAVVKVEQSFANCTATNMQRAMLRAQQIMEDEERKKEAQRAAPAPA